MKKACLLLIVMSAAQVRSPAPLEFVRILPGEFWMGCLESDLTAVPGPIIGSDSHKCPLDELPRHVVRITIAFEMSKYEITQEQWEAIMGTNPSYFKGRDRPVEQVSWDDVQDFLEKLNRRHDGYHYRLPTEAEWEYAAGSGAPGPFGGSGLANTAWYAETENTSILPLTESLGETHPVGRRKANAWGLYDMLGNVSEWVQDWYGKTYYQITPEADPAGPLEGEYASLGPYHIARGGSWHSIPSYLRVSDRYETVHGLRRRDIGFRCVRVPE
jgi:formylglycine-generating enzyme required for sulfatase activity